MRIGIEAQRIFRTNKHGMDIYTVQLIKHLQLIDTENTYFVFIRKDTDICIEETDNFTLVVFDSLFYVDWEQLLLPLKVKSYQLDFLMCTSNTAPLFCPVPILITLHDVIFLDKYYTGGTYYQRFGNTYRKWVLPKVIHRAKKVFTVSKFEANLILKHFKKNQKIVVIYNGIAPHFKSSKRKKSKVTFMGKKDFPKKYLLFIGNKAPKKNMDRVIEAYIIYCKTKTDPCDLVILDTERNQVLRFLKKRNAISIIQKIHCVGYVKNEFLPEIYANAKLFLYPSLRESFGLPLLESMASGTPVITSNTSSLSEIGGNAAAYVNPKNSRMLSNKIIELENNEALLKKMTVLGYKRAEMFSWYDTAKQILQNFNEILEKK